MLDNDSLPLLARAVEGTISLDTFAMRNRAGSEFAGQSQLWKAIVANEWLGMLTPEAVGGNEAGVAAATIVARRLGYACRPEPFIENVAALVCCRSQQHTVTKILTGQSSATIAWQAKTDEISLTSTGVGFRRVGPELVLSGSAFFVSAPESDMFVVGARGEYGDILCTVDRGQPGLEIVRQNWADYTRCGRINFINVRIATSSVLAQNEQAVSLFQEALDAAITLQSAHLLGAIDRTLEITLEYLKTRHQFGRAIGSFQVLRHRAVDLWILQQLTDAALAEAVRVIDSKQADARLRSAAASAAKYRASKSALGIATDAVQLHGAIGFTDDYELSLYFNRIVKYSAWLGNIMSHRRRFVAGMFPHDGATS